MENTFLVNNFNFEISLFKSVAVESGNSNPSSSSSNGNEVLGDGGFQECSGLEISMDVQELQEGGRNDGVIQQVGVGKYQNIVLKRGMFYKDKDALSSDMWEWMQSVLSGDRPVTRYDGFVKVFGHKESPTKAAPIVAKWAFSRALPVKISGPQLNAKSGEVAMEELHLAHEGLRLML